VHAYDFLGKGTLPPVVLLHGAGASGLSWAPVIRHLLPVAGRLLVPDLPGHGFSDPPARLTIPGVSLALDAAWNGEVQAPAFLVGHSLGALMAARFALRRPERVRGLVLLTPGGGTVAEGALDQVKAALDIRTRAAARAFVDRMLTKPAWYAPWVAPYVREAASRPSVRAIVQSACVSDMLTAAELGQLPPATLVLWGRQDRLVPLSDLAHLREGLPAQAEIVEVDGFGHGALVERPAEVARRLIGFIGRVAASTPDAVASTSRGERKTKCPCDSS
jgi:pimeloyl-ACP methyl ester carboxylesterase